MTFSIEPNQDPEVAFPIERSFSPRRLPEVARRYALAEGLVARADGRAVGAGTLAVYGGTLAWVGGMGVLPEFRRQGVARALLRALLARADALRVPVVGLDATDMGRPLYESEGFRAVVRTSRWTRAAPRADGPASACHSVHPISLSEAMEIGTFDLPRFGARRLPLLMALLRDFPWQAFMARDRRSGEVSGFAFGNDRAIGPLVADDPDAAAALLLACERAGALSVILALDDHEDAARVLREAGYAPDGVACTRMARGGTLPQGKAVYAPATWALG